MMMFMIDQNDDSDHDFDDSDDEKENYLQNAMNSDCNIQ